MFLSALVSQLEPDGSLVVDLADTDGPLLRFGPIAAGMPWERWEVDRWVGTDSDYGVLLINRAHESRRDLPVLRYLAGVPRAVLESLYCIRFLQATVLQFWARWPAARDLLESNRALLWLAAESYANEPMDCHRIVAALPRPQTLLLELVLREDVRPAQVRALRKIVLDSGDASTLAHIRRLATDPEAVRRLRHWARIPAGLLAVLEEAPYLAEMRLLRESVADAADDAQIARIVGRHRGLLRDTVRLAALLRPGRDAERVVTRCRSWARVQAQHDELTATVQTLEWESLLDSGVSPAQAFGPSPIASRPGFEAIGTVAELIAEGEEMHHCVVTRAREVIEGRAALYRVNVAGERGTLEISVGADREPLAIEDFRLACNAEPSERAWEAAERWLTEGRKQWRERPG